MVEFSTDHVVAALVCGPFAATVIEVSRYDPRNRWPGGRAEAGETPGQTLVREIGEETGFSIPHSFERGEPIFGNQEIGVAKLFQRRLFNFRTRLPYTQHLFLVKIANEADLLELDGKITQDGNATLKVEVRSIDKLNSCFVGQHLPLLTQVIDYLRQQQAA